MKKSGIVLVILLVGIISFVNTVSSINVVGKITGRVVENETAPEPEPNETETQECAASISMSFNKYVYSEGDSLEITVEVFDSYGSHLPNYDFYTEMYYENMWHTPFLQETGADGYFRRTGTAVKPAGGVTKVKFKVYTKESGSCGVVEDIKEIEYMSKEREEEPESQPEPAPPAEGSGTTTAVCAAEIKVTFDKELYYIGDTAEIVIDILDSQGNHLPNYVFYNQVYDTMWHTPGSDKTDNEGYFRVQPKVEKEQTILGRIKFKVYTGEYSNCNSVKDIAEIEVREREEEPEPVPCGIGTCIPVEEVEEVEAIPEDEILYRCNGCELEDKCYPMGYRKEGEYCSDNNAFISQIKGECENSFECKSNICISGECVGEGLMRRIIKWFKKLFGGDENKGEEEPGLKMCSKLLIEKNIGDYEYKESGYGGFKESQAPVISDEGEQIGAIKCCAAQYLKDEKKAMAIVCPYDDRQYVENLVKQLPLLNKNFVLREYKGQKAYQDKDISMVWAHDTYAIASGRAYEEGSSAFPEAIADAYLDKYPSDLGEIDIPEEPI